MRRVRILVLTYETPAYPGGGGASRQFCLLEPLARRNAVRVVSTGGRPRFGRTPQGVELELLDPGPELEFGGSWLRKNVGHYVHGRPWLHRHAEHHLQALRARLSDELARFTPDAVIVQHGQLGELLHAVPRRVARVLELHNMLLTVQLQQLRDGGAWDRAKSALELPLMARWESRDLRASTLSVAATARDARLARRLAPRTRIEVIENCVDTAYFSNPGIEPLPARMVFTASFHYQPNQEAARMLLDQVLPLVRAHVPDAELALVGQQMPDWLRTHAVAAAGAVVVGEVDDVRPHLWAATVAAAPMVTGSGSPLKAIEAMAAAVPVVGSGRVGRALGLARSGMHNDGAAGGGLIVADGPAATAASIIEILRNPHLRASLSRAAVTTARAGFDSAPAAARFEQLLRCAVERTRSSVAAG
jgi:glycosyltransferase involved in cell wall biosynthesis